MKKGFTLIELLVVVLIIGILSAIALPQYTVAVEKARLAEALSNMKYIKDQMKIRYMECGADCVGYVADYLELSGGEWCARNTEYCTKHFSQGFDHALSVGVRNKDDYDLGYQDESSWQGYMDLLLSGEDFDFCEAHTDLGYKICKSLESQGFELTDAR